jgi:flagellar secretion chaperone FliS
VFANPHQIYKQSSVQTASPAKLLLLLMDGAVRFLKQGIEGIEQGDIQKANTNLIKTQNIIYELIASLNTDYPVGKNLMSIYEYMIRRLTEANFHKKAEPAEEILSYLIELKDAWTQASRGGPQAQLPDHG